MFKKIASTFGIKAFIAIINLAIVIVLSRYLGAEGKGEASLIITSIAMILLFSNMVGGSTLVYFVPRNNILPLFLWSNVWSVLVCLVSYFILIFFSGMPATTVIPVVLLSLINSLLATNLTILLGKEKINTYNLISLLQIVANATILLFLLINLNEKNIGAYIHSLYGSMGLCLLISTFFVFPFLKNNPLKKDPELPRKLLKNGVSSQAGHIMKFASFRCTYYLLAEYSGDAQVGIFSNGVSLVESTFLICNSIATFLYPKVANSMDLKHSQTLTLQLTKVCIVCCIAALIPLVLLPSSFFIWLFGPEFSNVHEVILLLAPGILLYNVALVIGHYFSGIGRFRVNTWANFTGLITTLVLSAVWYPAFSIREISIISTLSYFTTSVLVILYFVKDARIKAYDLLPTYKDYKWLRLNSKTIFKK
jgi:O-antigen/teichoic acid export membrane protein